MPLSNKHPLERRQDSQGPDQRNTTKCESKIAISHILGLSSNSLHHQLEEIIKILDSVSWLKMGKGSAVFVANGQNELVLAAQIGRIPSPKGPCPKVLFGTGLCGKSAESKTLHFRKGSCIKENANCKGDSNLGQFCIPLLNNDAETIGTLLLSRQPSEQPHPEEAGLFQMVGCAVSSTLQNRTLEFKVEINRIRLQHAQQEILHKLVAAAEFRDNETGEHIRRMTRFSVAIGRKYGLGKNDLDLLKQAAPMHDIGKVGIPDKILLKPGRLSEEEMTTMKKHTLIGGGILSGNHPLIVASRQIALTHHEKWDGSGYPHGLAGENIPLFGRICAIADVFDALTTSRPYKDAWPLEKAISLINDNSGKHFDPILVEVFNAVLPEILDVKDLFTRKKHIIGENELEQLPTEKEIQGWDNSLSVGVEFIDDQHQYLINLINCIGHASDQFDPKKVVTAFLNLKSYAEFHFSHEEELMQKSGFPDLAAHIETHKSFFITIDHFLNELEEFPLATTSEASEFLNGWLITHIKAIDGQYGRFLKEKTKAEIESGVLVA